MPESYTYSEDYFAIQTAFALKWHQIRRPTTDDSPQTLFEQKTTLKKAFMSGTHNDEGLKLWDKAFEGVLLDETTEFVLRRALYSAYLELKQTEPEPEEVSGSDAPPDRCLKVEFHPERNKLRSHYVPMKIGQESALSRGNRATRFEQYQQVFGSLALQHDPEIIVIGNSWLYNLEAFNWLFPENIERFNTQGVRIDGRTDSTAVGQRIYPRDDSRHNEALATARLDSWSTWGQFLQKNYQVYAPYVQEFLAKVNVATSIESLFDAFPLPERFTSNSLDSWIKGLFNRTTNGTLHASN